MKANIKNAIKGAEEWELIELENSLHIARTAKVMMKNYNKDINWLAKELELSVSQTKAFIGGYYNYDLRIVAKLDCAKLKLELEMCKDQHKGVLTFPEYKYSKQSE